MIAACPTRSGRSSERLRGEVDKPAGRCGSTSARDHFHWSASSLREVFPMNREELCVDQLQAMAKTLAALERQSQFMLTVTLITVGLAVLQLVI